MSEERLEMRITPLTIMEAEKLMNWLTVNGEYIAQIGNLKMQYKWTIEDTISGKREIFYIERKIKQWKQLTLKQRILLLKMWK